MSSNNLKLKLFGILETSSNIFVIKSLPLWNDNGALQLQLKIGSTDISTKKQKLERPRFWKKFHIRSEQFSKKNTIPVLNLTLSLVWRRVIRRRRIAVAIVVKKLGNRCMPQFDVQLVYKTHFGTWIIWAAQGSKGKNQLEFFLATFQGSFFNFSLAKVF